MTWSARPNGVIGNVSPRALRRKGLSALCRNGDQGCCGWRRAGCLPGTKALDIGAVRRGSWERSDDLDAMAGRQDPRKCRGVDRAAGPFSARSR
jgi:hypothetical protein